VIDTKPKSLSSEIQLTADGSHTLFVPSMDEHYHSVNGAKTEAEHIYINYGLSQCKASSINILEIGFGTGLNAYLSLVESENSNRKIVYTSLELYPLSMNQVKELNYPKVIYPEFADLYYRLHEAEWGKLSEIVPTFSLLKINTDFTKISDSEKSLEWTLGTIENKLVLYDVVYFDAFAPEKQPEMWQQEFFDSIYKSMNTNGILTTYCAKGVIRRMLQSAGFKVEKLPGPPGKREVLRATKL